MNFIELPILVTAIFIFLISFPEIGHMLHPCESDLVLKCTNENVPYFNAPIYLENKQQIGKVDEIFGPVTDFISFSVAAYDFVWYSFGFTVATREWNTLCTIYPNQVGKLWQL